MTIRELYNDPKFAASFAGKKRFVNAVLSENKNIKRKNVEDELRKIDSYTLHKPTRRTKLFRRIYTKGIGYIYQIDLIDMTKFENENDGYRWLITIIDAFSKKAWAFKLKRKTSRAILNVMKPFLESNTPKKMEFDQGMEFYNSSFLNLLKTLKIEYYSVYSDRKCAIVERFNRTLKTRMYRSFTARGSKRWIDILEDLVNGYNNTPHSSIKHKPNDVNKENEILVRRILFPKERKQKIYTKAYFKIGDTVRIQKKKATFQKGYEQTYSYEVFEVYEVRKTYPVTYRIKDYKGGEIKGSFYKSELQLVNKSDNIWPVKDVLDTRKHRGVTEYLVNFVGYPETLTEWIPQNQLFNNAD